MNNLVFYPFLFAIYPIIFFIGYNKLWFTPFSIWFCAALILGGLASFFLLNLFIKNKHKSALILTSLIILFYQDGNNLPLNYKIMSLVILFILTLIFSYFIVKTPKKLSFTTPILNVIAVVMIILSTLTIIQGKFEIKNLKTFFKNEEIENIIKQTHDKKIIAKDLPDIYYIIPDEYAGFDTLKKYYNFDNKEFKNFLEQKGFYVPENSFCNYPCTRLSMNSSLNMEYINYNIPPHFDDEIGLQHIFDNNLIKILNSYGYETIIFLNNWQTARDTHKSFLKNWDIVINQVPINSIDIHILKQTIFRFILFDYFSHEIRKYKYNSFESLNELTKKPKKQPRFIYFHILLPHAPYLFDENGDFKWTNPDNFLKYYPNQLKYTNKLLEKSIETILENDKNAIIIVQSDHGERNLADKTKDEKVRYNNIVAIYMPEKYRDKTKLYQNITPVNIFRTILNPVLGLNLKPLKDEIITTGNCKQF